MPNFCGFYIHNMFRGRICFVEIGGKSDGGVKIEKLSLISGGCILGFEEGVLPVHLIL